jgi:hypothetical protein
MYVPTNIGKAARFYAGRVWKGHENIFYLNGFTCLPTKEKHILLFMSSEKKGETF